MTESPDQPPAPSAGADPASSPTPDPQAPSTGPDAGSGPQPGSSAETAVSPVVAEPPAHAPGLSAPEPAGQSVPPDPPPTPGPATGPPTAAPVVPAASPSWQASSTDGSASSAQTSHGRPELLVGAAFAGGLVLATILKRLGS